MRRRRLWIVAGIGLALVVVIGGAVVLSFRDTATPTSEEDVVAGLGTLVVGTEPGDPGLYTYRTSGFSTTDALGGGRHDYPPETYITLQPGGCGVLVRWIPLQERILEWEFCDDVPIPSSWRDFHRWFGVAEDSTFRCDAVPERLPETGESWDAACSSDDTTKDDTWEVVGREDLQVGGRDVTTVHVQRRSDSTGRTVGPLVSDAWYLEGTVLPVRMTLLSDTVTSSPIGDVEFHEEFTLELIGLTPES